MKTQADWGKHADELLRDVALYSETADCAADAKIMRQYRTLATVALIKAGMAIAMSKRGLTMAAMGTKPEPQGAKYYPRQWDDPA